MFTLNKDGDLSFQAFKNGGVTVGQKKEGALESFDHFKALLKQLIP